MILLARVFRTRGCGCEARFSVTGSEEGLKVTNWFMIHNHTLERSVMEMHPAFRKLTDAEMKEVEPFLQKRCRVDTIKAFVLNRMGKHITTMDVSNMRRNYPMNHSGVTSPLARTHAGGRKRAFREYSRSILFAQTRETGQQLSDHRRLSSEATVSMGLPKKKKIIREVCSSEDEAPTIGTETERPARLGMKSAQFTPIPLLQSPPASRSSDIPPRTTPLPREHDVNIPVTTVCRVVRPKPVEAHAADDAVASTSQRSHPVSLEDVHQLLIEVARQTTRMESMLARVYEANSDLQRSIQQAYAVRNTVGDSQPSSSILPAYSIENVIALDEKLFDQQYCRQLSDQFLAIPGDDLRTLVRNILCRLISPTVTEVIHCSGKDQPYVFRNSRLYGFLLDQIRRRSAFATVHSSAVAYEAQLWFRLHRERVDCTSQEPAGNIDDLEEWFA